MSDGWPGRTRSISAIHHGNRYGGLGAEGLLAGRRDDDLVAAVRGFRGCGGQGGRGSRQGQAQRCGGTCHPKVLPVSDRGYLHLKLRSFQAPSMRRVVARRVPGHRAHGGPPGVDSAKQVHGGWSTVITRRDAICGILGVAAATARAAPAFRPLQGGSFAGLVAARRDQPFLLVLWSITCGPCRTSSRCCARCGPVTPACRWC